MKIRPILIFSHIFFENSLQFQKLCLPLQPQTRKIGAIAQLVEHALDCGAAWPCPDAPDGAARP